MGAPDVPACRAKEDRGEEAVGAPCRGDLHCGETGGFHVAIFGVGGSRMQKGHSARAARRRDLKGVVGIGELIDWQAREGCFAFGTSFLDKWFYVATYDYVRNGALYFLIVLKKLF